MRMTEEQCRILFETLRKGMKRPEEDEPGMRRLKNLMGQTEKQRDKIRYVEDNSRD